MAKKFPDQFDVGFKTAVERARKYPSQIADIEAVVSMLTNESGTSDFEVKAELYALMAKVSTSAEKIKVLQYYRQGLGAVAREGQINLREMWQAGFADERVKGVLVDRKLGQLIVSTSPREKVKRAGIYALDLKDGKERWSAPMKKNQSAFNMHLGEFAVFFTTDSHSENEDQHHTSYLCALSLKNGSQVMKWSPENKGDGGIERIEDIFGDLILVQGEWSSHLFALNTETQKEEWRANGSHPVILEDGFLISNKRELVWLDKNGLPQKKLKLSFPKRDQGYVSGFLENDGVIYVSVYDSWNTYNKDFSITKNHSHAVFYSVGKRDAKVQWAFTPTTKEMRCKRIIPTGNLLYFCGIENTVVLARSNGKLVRELPYLVLYVSGKLFFHTDARNQFSESGFTFYARDTETNAVKWQRKNFELLETKNSLLFGRVENSLVILDEVTGKERANVAFGSEPRQIGFVEDNIFWVRIHDSKSIVVFQMEYPEDRL